jgi:hypothetical protein
MAIVNRWPVVLDPPSGVLGMYQENRDLLTLEEFRSSAVADAQFDVYYEATKCNL